MRLRDEDGNIIRWVGSTTDIEDVRRTRKLEADTARLMKQRTELMELNVAKDEFISLASHQLRTPATGVKQYINMALDGYAGEINPKLRMFLEKANDSNERQLTVINDLLKVAQVDAGHVILRKQTIDVGEVVPGILNEQSEKFAKRNQEVIFEAPDKKMLANVDGVKLRMVIENVIDNASKYTPQGKNIRVDLRNTDGFVTIAVTDEGVGIAKKNLDKVFQKFLRIDNSLSAEVGGTGLGLYWVKKIVDLHNGTIEVDSRMNKGSTFTISLPAAE